MRDGSRRPGTHRGIIGSMSRRTPSRHCRDRLCIAFILFIVSILLPADALPQKTDQDVPIVVVSYQDVSCGAWVKSARIVSERAQYISWSRPAQVSSRRFRSS